MAKHNLTPRAKTFSTRAIHGKKLYPFKAPVATPIVQTSTYRFESSDDAVRYAHGDPDVLVYTRYHNPTVTEAQERLALMMEAEKALLLSSGMAAISCAILAAAKMGDEILSTPALYGGTYRFFRDILPDHGIKVGFVNPARPDDLERMISPKTTVMYLETPTNPTIGIVDIAKLVAATRRGEKRAGGKVAIIADNTFATVLNQNPLHLGADVLVESATKYLGGHADLMGGVVAGPAGFVRSAHTRMKYYGSCADPFAAYLLVRSLKTFELRVQRQNENAFSLARFLEKHRNVLRVFYPGLRSHPGYLVARKQMTGGFGGMVTMEVRGGAEGAAAVCDALCVAVNAMSLGGVETLVSIPVYSSHIGMTEEELKNHGVTPGMVRISAGIEGIEDLKEDFGQALDKIPEELRKKR